MPTSGDHITPKDFTSTDQTPSLANGNNNKKQKEFDCKHFKKVIRDRHTEDTYTEDIKKKNIQHTADASINVICLKKHSEDTPSSLAQNKDPSASRY